MNADAAPIWVPSPERIRNARLTDFIRLAAGRSGREFPDYPRLHQWSVARREEFWPLVAEFTGLVFRRPAEQILIDGDRMPGTRWFAGAELNFAEQLLRCRDQRPAIVFRGEDGVRDEVSFAALCAQVGALAAALRATGVERGDRIAGFLPNHPAAVIGMLASASIGAVWTSCSPDFGVTGVLDRFGQIAPKVLFTADGYRYGGKVFDAWSVAAEVAQRCPSIRRVVVVPFLRSRPAIESVPEAVLWEEFLAEPQEPQFAALPFDHPLYVLFSSGTTGAPKCIVHGAGGTLLQHLKEHVLHTDLGPADRLFYFTTCGWMMWNWLVSALAGGTTIVLYDGSPFHPGPDTLWRLVEEEGVTVFGTSAKYLAAVEKSGYQPAHECRLARLRTILSTGSPLAPESYDFVYRDVKSDVQLASISGGTDIVSCFALGNPLLPVYRGELQCAGLGMAVDVFDDSGRPLKTGKGELVCTRSFPSMPVGFWNDSHGQAYRHAYFERFPGVWTHGDYAERTPHGGFIIHGRSDATLNPGGVRIGTAEIYRAVESLPEVVETLAIGQDWQGDTRIVLFVVMRAGATLTEPLRESIRAAIRAALTPRHVPARILAVPELPRTRNGKLSELAVRAIVHGEPVTNTGALANPASLEHFRSLPELGV
jgi:acetoacetyl-CoA synthetase